MSLCIHVILLLASYHNYPLQVQGWRCTASWMHACMHGFLVTGEAQSTFLFKEGAQGDVDHY